MEIDIKNILAAYETATENEKTLLSTLFPDLLLGQTKKVPGYRSVTERIKTFGDACHELGEKHPLVVEWSKVGTVSSDLEAYLQLRIICAALNEGWEPKFTENEWRFFPRHYLWTEGGLLDKSDERKADNNLILIGDKYQSGYVDFTSEHTTSASVNPYIYIGSRLCLKSEELAAYCGKQFIGIWTAFLLPQKKNV